MYIIDFLNNWTIDLNKLQTYEEFKKPFTVSFDKKICDLLISGINPKITMIMIKK